MLVDGFCCVMVPVFGYGNCAGQWFLLGFSDCVA